MPRGCGPRETRIKAWLWFDDLLNAALRPFHLYVVTHPRTTHTHVSPNITLYQLCSLQIHNYLAEGFHFSYCAMNHAVSRLPVIEVEPSMDSAIPTIYPFVREIIADVSRRVGVEQYVIVSLESPRVSGAILNRMVDDLARAQQEVIAESRSATSD